MYLIADVAKSVDVLGEHGDNKKKNIMSIQGTSNSYRIAKLKRDYPEVAQG